MIYALRGKVGEVREGFFVLECHGIFFKVYAGGKTISALLVRGEEVKVFCAMFLREDEAPELFGFLDEAALRLFELLRSVSGIGPKMALRILDLGSVEQITAAIASGDAELLASVPGVGKKTAARLVVELKGRVHAVEAGTLLAGMKTDQEVEDALAGLGYPRAAIREAMQRLGGHKETFQERFRKVIKELGRQ